MKFAAHLELDLDHIKSVLCFDIIAYLTFEGVIICEDLDLHIKQSGSDIKPQLMRIHLVSISF